MEGHETQEPQVNENQENRSLENILDVTIPGVLNDVGQRIGELVKERESLLDQLKSVETAMDKLNRVQKALYEVNMVGEPELDEDYLYHNPVVEKKLPKKAKKEGLGQIPWKTKILRYAPPGEFTASDLHTLLVKKGQAEEGKVDRTRAALESSLSIVNRRVATEINPRTGQCNVLYSVKGK